MGEGFIFQGVARQDLLSKDLKEVRAGLCGYPGGASLYEEEQVHPPDTRSLKGRLFCGLKNGHFQSEYKKERESGQIGVQRVSEPKSKALE